MQDAHGFGGDQRGFLGRLGDDTVARHQRRGDLADEDGQREIPRADAQHRPQRLVRGGERLAGLIGVTAQEIHGLAHFGDGIGGGFAGLADDEPHQQRHLGFQPVGGALQHGGALIDGNRGP